MRSFNLLTTKLLAITILITLTPAVAFAQSDRTVGWIELSGTLRDGPLPFAWVPEDEAKPSLTTVIKSLDHVAESDTHLGLVIYLNEPRLTLQQIEALGRALDRIRDTGKKIITFSETYSTNAYLIASHADIIALQSKGVLMLHGLHTEEMYLAGLLERMGIEADFMQVGRYKGADEALTRKAPTPFWDENMDGLLDDLYDQIIEHIATRRDLTAEQVEALMRDSWLLSDTQLVRRGAIDEITSRDMEAVIVKTFGNDITWDDQLGSSSAKMPENPFVLFQMLFREQKTKTEGPTLAIIHARGPIHMGESSVDDGQFSDDSIGHNTLIDAFRDAQEDDNIKGVVLRIDSPGGSAIASDVIWQAVRETGETKPVFVSVGRLAASGGYYIACAGDEIYVEAPSIVGSIGVVSGKIHLAGLYEKLDLGVTVRSRGPMADMFASDRPFTPAERHTMLAFMERIYDQFVDRIRTGRGERLIRIDQVAEGRLFTGRQATENGLADRLGGLEIALSDLASDLNLTEGEYDVINLPEPLSFQDFMQQAFGVSSPATQLTLPALARNLLGDRWSNVGPIIQGAMLLQREPALLLMPVAIDLRITP
ncbi:MAG: signal peptide peptidase SppA [Phycisphaeraceae bacterium]